MKYTGNLPFGTRQVGQYSLGVFSSGTQVITIDSNNNVGIGTTAPNSKLEVVGAVTFSSIDTFGQFVIKSATGTTGDLLNFGVDSTNNVAFIQANDRGTATIPLSLQRYGGNVGIGTTTPFGKLSVFAPDGNTPSLELGRADTGNVWRFNHAGADLRIYNTAASGSDILLGVDSGGFVQANRVGIGTATPAHKLDVAGGVFADYFQLDTTATPTPVAGMLYWDADEETAAIKVNDISYELGQQQAWVVKNQSGAQLNKGTLVMATGTVGASGRILVEKMVANGTVSSKYILGVALENIPDGADGKVLHVGKVRQIDTTGTAVGETWNDGDVLWAHPTSAGAFTNVEPSAPNLRLPVAFVLSAAANGSIAIRITAGNILHELHDVDASSPSNGDLLVYNSSTGVWENQTVSSAIATPTLDAVTTAGNTTTNSITVGNIDAANSITLGGIAQMSQNNNQAYIQNISGSAIITLDSPISANGTNNIGIGTILPTSFVHIDLPLAADRFQISRGGTLKAYVDGNGQIVSYANLVSYGNSLAGGGGMFQYAGGTTTAAVGHRFKHLNNSFSASSGDQTMVEIVPSIAQTGTAGYTGLKVNVTETTTGSGAKNLMDLQVGGASKFSVSNTGDVTVAGILTAQEFRTEYITQTVIFESGSTAFGNTADDTHSFTGSLELEGDATVTGDVTAANFIGDGSQLTNISSGAISVTLDDVTTNGATTTNSITVGGVTSTDDILISGGNNQISFYASSPTGYRLYRNATAMILRSDGNIQEDAASTYSIKTGAAERLRVTSTGNVGIGDTAPTSKLSVLFSSNSYAAGYFRNNGTAPGLQVNQQGTGAIFEALDNSASVFIIKDGGNVGIGTTSPAKVLHIQPPAATDDGIRLTSSAGGNLISLYQENGTEAFIRMYSNNAEKIQLRANGDSYFNNGKIGIGTSSPTQALTVHSADNTRIEIKDTGENIISHWGTNTGAAFLTTESAHPLKFYTTGAMRMIIDANGKIGINTSSPSAYLHISDTDASAYAFRTTNGGTNTFLTDIAGNVYAKGTMTLDGSMLYGDVDKPFIITGGGGATAVNGFMFTHTGNTDFSNTTGERSFMKLVPEISQTGAARYIAFDVQVSEVTTGSGPNYLARFRVGSNDKTRINNAGDIWTVGAVTGSYFVGDGSQLTNISSGAVSVDLDDVTTNGATTTNAITVGGLTVDTDTLHVDATNNRVGIGTTSPAQKLDVVGTIRSQVTSPGAGNGDVYAFAVHEFNGNNGRMGLGLHDTGDAFLGLYSDTGVTTRIDSNGSSYFMGGNVGIGTTSPGAKLDVVGDVRVQYANSSTTLSSGGSILRLANSDTTANNISAIDFPQSSAGSGFSRIGVIYKDRTASSEDQDMFFRTIGGGSSAEVMRLTSTGNVGIGTTSPGAKLDLYGASPTTVYESQLRIYGSETTGNQDTGGAIAFSGHDGVAGRTFGFIRSMKENSAAGHYAGYMSFGTRANGSDLAEKMRITSAGNVGIGTTTPATKLHIVDNATTPNSYALTLQSDSTQQWKIGVGNAGYFPDVLLISANGSGQVVRIWPTGTVSLAGDVQVYQTLSVGSTSTDPNGATVWQTARHYTGSPAGTKIQSFSFTYVGAFIDYVIYDTNKDNMRSGTLQMVFNNTNTVHFTDNSTLDIGDTSQASFTASLNGFTTELFFVAPDPDWHVKYHVRYL